MAKWLLGLYFLYQIVIVYLAGQPAFVFCAMFIVSVLIFYFGLNIRSFTELKVDILANKMPALVTLWVVFTIPVLVYMMPEADWLVVLALSSILCPSTAATGYLWMRWANKTLNRFHQWVKGKMRF